MPVLIVTIVAQATRTKEIYEALRADGQDNVVVLGDFNDTPDSAPLLPLLANTDLVDVSLHPTFDTGEFKGRPGTNERGIGTFALGNDRDKIDFLLLSPALFARLTASGLFRKGAWPGCRAQKLYRDRSIANNAMLRTLLIRIS